MKFQRVNALVMKEIKMIYRNPPVLFLTLLFPLILTVSFGVAFGSFGTSNETTYTVGIVDLDETAWSDYFSGNLSTSDVLVGVTYTDDTKAQEDLEQGVIDAYLILPNDFGDSINSFWGNLENPGTWVNTTVELYVDQGSLIATAALPLLIQQILLTTLYGQQDVPQSVQIGSPALVEADHNTQFDMMAPGMFAFASIFIIMIVAVGFAEEREQGLLQRLQMTPTSSAEIITARIIANMITAMLQIAVIFIASAIMGFNPKGGLEGIILAFVMVLLLALCNVGFGLITATIAKSSGAVTGISFIFILPQMFLGTFVPAPETISMLVPSYYVTHALTSVLLRGASIFSPAIIIDFGVMVVFCGVVIITGILLFSKIGKK